MSTPIVARSPLSRWTTPSGRLLCCVVLVAGTATAPVAMRATLWMSALIAIAVVVLARPTWRTWWRRALPALLMIGALLVPLAVVRVPDAAAIAVRATIVVVIALGFAATLRLEQLAPALRGVGLPASLAGVIETMLRQLSVVRDEGRRLALARRLRGARGRTWGAETVSALLVRTITRAERTELAMRLRGGADAVRLSHARLRLHDAPAVLVSAVAATAMHVGGHWW